MPKKSAISKQQIAKPAEGSIYDRICAILESAQAHVARSVNTTQVVANWLIGREIVEEQQHGEECAAYGEELILELSVRLTRQFGKGYSKENLFLFRRFYLGYSGLVDEKLYAPRTISSNAKTLASKDLISITPVVSEIFYALRTKSWKPGLLHPNLSWTHYRTLIAVESTDARSFYEIEAIQNNWSARELERQIHSLQLQLYVNYYDAERRTAGDQPTLGLILCTDKNDSVVRYTLGPEQSQKLFASRYKLHVPSEEELLAEIHRELKHVPAIEKRKPKKKKPS